MMSQTTTDGEYQRLRAAFNEATQRIRQLGAEEIEIDRKLRTAASEDSRRRTEAAKEGKSPSEASQVEPELRQRARDLPHERRAAELDAANSAVAMHDLQHEVARADAAERVRKYEDAAEAARPYIEARDAAKADMDAARARLDGERDRLRRARQALGDLEDG